MGNNVLGVMAALQSNGVDVLVRTNGEWGWCAAIGQGGQWIVEQASCADLETVEAFLRAQAALHFPNVVLP